MGLTRWRWTEATLTRVGNSSAVLFNLGFRHGSVVPESRVTRVERDSLGVQLDRFGEVLSCSSGWMYRLSLTAERLVRAFDSPANALLACTFFSAASASSSFVTSLSRSTSSSSSPSLETGISDPVRMDNVRDMAVWRDKTCCQISRSRNRRPLTRQPS